MTHELSPTAPLLSICIPTYNGARRLESALYALAPQVAEAGGVVELIVSDNCSTDDTAQVVEGARRWGPIRYHRNEQNEGQARNVLRLTNELARGEFAWVLGDDDLVRPDGVARVLAVLQSQPEIDYVFVNVTARSAAERNAFGRPVNGADFPDLMPVKAKSLTDRYVELWDELVDPNIDDVFLGSLMVSVVRLARFRSYRLEIGAGHETWASLPHAYALPTVLAHTMPGRKAYYIGHPCIIAFFGEQEWLGYYPIIILVRLQELLDLYRQNGVAAARVEMCRRSLLNLSARPLRAVLFDRDNPGRAYFSLREFIWRNRHHRARLGLLFAQALRGWGLEQLPAPLGARLRNARQHVRQFLG